MRAQFFRGGQANQRYMSKLLKQLFTPSGRRKARLAFAPLFTALCTALLLTQTACTQTRGPAPVVDSYPSASKPAVKPKPDPQAAIVEKTGFYVVKKGDTLYSVSLEHNVDYRDLAEWNNIDQSQVIRIGQQLRISPPDDAAVTAPLKSMPPAGSTAANPGAHPSVPNVTPGSPGAAPTASANAVHNAVKVQPKANKLPYSDQALARLLTVLPKPAPGPAAGTTTAKAEPSIAPPAAAKAPAAKAPGEAPAAAAGEADEERIDWGWPAEGKIVASFNEGDKLKGVDIAGKLGQPVIASAPGRVVYSGAGLRGYGKLVIIRHNKTYLSAYAHNSRILVKEGQSVAKGQKIAEMGNSDADQVKLHFEIRRLGKPVDPVRYLPGAKS